MPPPETKLKPLTNLRRLRLEQGMTQLQLAAQADLTVSTVQKVESSTSPDELHKVELWTWRKLAQVLKVKVRDIYPGLAL